MGEVGVSAGENPTETLTLNGDMNGGSCDEDHDEPMDVDPLESSANGKAPDNEDTATYDKDILTEDDEKSNLTEDSGTDINRLKDNVDDKSLSSVPEEEDDVGVDDDELSEGVNDEEDHLANGNSNNKINDLEEIHDIPDSDEDEVHEKSNDKLEKNPLDIDEPMEVDGTSNGHIAEDDDDDKPVSIHSDSESEVESNSIVSKDIKTPEKKSPVTEKAKNGDADVHEVLSDKEDCMVVEDGKDGGNKEEDLSPRRSQRQRKSVVQVRNFANIDDDDIQEITEDPLQTSGNKTTLMPGRKNLMITPSFTNQTSSAPQMLIKDARSLAPAAVQTSINRPSSGSLQAYMQQQQLSNQQQNNKKEPTLVIIDTNSILAGRGGQAMPQNLSTKSPYSVHPVGVPAQGIYPPGLSRTSITAVGAKPLNFQTTPQPTIQSQLLPALTDDMFVLEAPSFIVPYIYEKPPAKHLKDIVSRMGVEVEERLKKEVEEKLVKKQEIVEEKEKKIDEDSQSSKDTADGEPAPPKDETKKSSKRKQMKNGDDSWDESDTSTDDEASDSELRTKVLIKEVNEDIDIKKHIITPDSAKDVAATPTQAPPLLPIDPTRKSDNYFESPLGKFFMTIGINLVQEHVQTDLLRQQKKKRDRDGQATPQHIQVAINALMKNLELSREKNEPFKFNMKRCEYCNYKAESALAMAHHYETPHNKNFLYKCNFCTFETRPPHDILFHMEAVHNIKGRLEKGLSYHQCPNCPFEDNGKSKLARHSVVCAKKYRPDLNLAAPSDWEPPAKIPRIKPKHGLVGTATAYQAMAAQQQQRANMVARQSPAQAAALMRARAGGANVVNVGGRQLPIQKMPIGGVNNQQAIRGGNNQRSSLPPGMNNYQFATTSGGQFIQSSTGAKPSPKTVQQPSISITPLPRQSAVANQLQPGTIPKPPGMASMKPGQSPAGGGKTAFVVCEICDGYIKDLDQLRNHMQWIHKIKIHPKMIYNRPPLNCQKCQYRFFTDQGLERHLLGSHGLVTSSMQEAANKGKDAGRCPVCGRVYQWKLLNHVSRDHNMTLKPAHLSYKCTVCTATFGMYKQFENHVYSAHSTVAKKSADSRKSTGGQPGGSSSTGNNSNHSSKLGDSLLKPLKINDEITIIPQPASKSRPMEIESHVID